MPEAGRLMHCVVASVGVEPTAYRLSGDCSTTELTRGLAERTGFEPAIIRIDSPVHLAAMRPLRFGSGGANRTRVGRLMRPAWGPAPSPRLTDAPGTVTIRPLKLFRLALIHLSYRLYWSAGPDSNRRVFALQTNASSLGHRHV